jgi:hypothetical protein
LELNSQAIQAKAQALLTSKASEETLDYQYGEDIISGVSQSFEGEGFKKS